jgi:hypothetical protein
MSLQLSDRWAPRLTSQLETGMGYQICKVKLKDGRCIEGVTIVGGTITKAIGYDDLPFSEADIDDIVVTHGK